MLFVLSAQPIDQQGRIGFEDRNALEAEHTDLAVVLDRIREQIVKFDLADPDLSAWDLTLEVRP